VLDFLKKQAQAQRQNQSQMQTSEKNYAITPDFVHWEKVEKFGITRESIKKTGNLEKVMDYRKTD
jgi:hypothetical protein